MSYHWSATTVGFYPDALRAIYEAAGSWPSDAVPCDDATFAAYAGTAPPGTKRSVVAGLPAWVDA